MSHDSKAKSQKWYSRVKRAVAVLSWIFSRRDHQKNKISDRVCVCLCLSNNPLAFNLWQLKLVIYANRQRSAKHLWVYLNTNSRKTSDIEPFWWLVWATYTVIAYNASFSPLSSTKARNMPLSIFKRSLGLPSSTYTHYMSSNLTSICQFTTYDLPSI